MIVSCSWCHEPCDLAQFRHCATCGHRADLPRAECDCEQCQAQPFNRPASREEQYGRYIDCGPAAWDDR